MFYENADAELLKFLHDPLSIIQVLINRKTKLKLSTKLLYKIPRLRPYISAKQVEYLLQGKLKRNLLDVQSTLDKDIYKDLDPISQKNFHRYLSELRNYFHIGVYLDDIDRESTEVKNLAEVFIQSFTWARLE